MFDCAEGNKKRMIDLINAFHPGFVETAVSSSNINLDKIELCDDLRVTYYYID